jgi:uncharacterized Zn-binding protein involved in type VI secretion
MPNAARLSDSTSHGSPLLPGPGSLNVLINGRPAWLALSDFHTCPLVDVLKPHVGGTVLIGSKTVFINGRPATRVGDMIVEAGAPNVIISGSPNVNIGT